jgi:uncharacterized protein YlbG (UPF0298 family)
MNFIITEQQYRLILEQPDFKMPFQIEKFGYKSGNPKTHNKNIEEQSMGGMMSPTYMSDPKNIKDFGDFIYEYRHGLLDVAAFGALAIPLVGPYLSIGIELGNAALYAKEGEDYSAGLSLVFALIPGGFVGKPLLNKIPALRYMTKQELRQLMKKISNPKTVKTLSKTEKELMEQVNKHSKWLILTATKELTKKITIGLFKKLNLPKIVNLFYYFGLKYPKTFSVTTMGLKIGALWYSWDKLAGIYGIKDNNEKNIKKQKELNSEFDSNRDKVIEGVVKDLEQNVNTEEQNIQFQEYVATRK